MQLYYKERHGGKGTRTSGSSGKSSSMQILTLSSNSFSLLFTARLLTFRYSLCCEAQTLPSGVKPLPLSLHRAWNPRPESEDFRDGETPKRFVLVSKPKRGERQMEAMAFGVGLRRTGAARGRTRAMGVAAEGRGGGWRGRRRWERRGSI